MTGRTSHRHRITAECSRRGRAGVVADCVAVLQSGRAEPDLLLLLGGTPAVRMLHGRSRADASAWARVWAARGLLWALDEATVALATDAVVDALGDPAWRVREKAAQVVARHLVDAALPAVVAVAADDTVSRVRKAAARALQRLATAG